MQTVTYIHTTLTLCRRERKSNFGSFYHVNARVRPPPAPPRNLAVNAPETDFHPLVTDDGGGSEQIKRSAAVHPPTVYYNIYNTAELLWPPETKYVRSIYIYTYILYILCIYTLWVYIYTGISLDYTFALKHRRRGLYLREASRPYRINTPASPFRLRKKMSVDGIHAYRYCCLYIII